MSHAEKAARQARLVEEARLAQARGQVAGAVDTRDGEALTQLSASDRVPLSSLAALEVDTAVRVALESAHVRDILLEIRESQDAVAALKAAMQRPVFVEFADACLAVCGLKRKDEAAEAARE